MHPHWIEFLAEARALLAILILTIRTSLALRTLRSRGVRPSPAPADAAACLPAATTSTSTPDRFSRTAGVVLQVTQVTAAGLAVLDWLINSSFT